MLTLGRQKKPSDNERKDTMTV